MLSVPTVSGLVLPDPPKQVFLRVPFEPLRTILAEDFEAGDGRFTASGNISWQHGSPSVHVLPAPGQGPNVWGTNLDGAYDDRDCGWIESPPIDLTGFPPGGSTGASTARLMFRHWYHFEPQWDGGVVSASIDGGATWTVVPPVNGYVDRIIHSDVRACLGVKIGERVFTGPAGTTPPAADAWHEVEMDLTPFMGETLILRWIAAADHIHTRLGWYVDDVLVQVGAGAFVHQELPPVGAAGVPFTPVVAHYAADFSIDEAGWAASGTPAWAWGETVSPPHPPTGGLNVWGTVLDDVYPVGACSFLTSPTIPLPGADAAGLVDAAQLSFQLWRHIRSGYDAAALHVSTDGGATWQLVEPREGYDRTVTQTASQGVRDCLGIGTTDLVWSGPSSAPRAEEWLDLTADLTPFMGNDIQLRFGFASTELGGQTRGAYVGGAVIHLGVGASVDATKPPSAHAPGWTVAGTDPSWSYGVASSGPFSSRPVWATGLDGPHHRAECSAIVSPPIDTRAVPGLGALTLSFEHFFRAGAGDAGLVQVSRDGGATWSIVTPLGGYPSTMSATARACLGAASTQRGYVGNPTGNAYVGADVNLNAHAGGTLHVAFTFSSDTATEDLGWYVRNVRIHRGAASVPLTPTSSNDPLADKADAALRQALGDAPGRVDVMVTGFPHADVSDLQRLPRHEALAALDARAAPFVEGVARVAQLAGGEIVGAWASAPAVKVRVPAAGIPLLAQRADVRGLALDSDEAVRLVEPLPPSPDDGLGALNTQGRNMIEAEEMWALGYRGEGIVVAVIDTGIDATHEAFRRADGSSRVAAFVDLAGGASAPYDDHGHGTHVAGTSVGSAHYVHPTWGAYQEVGVAPEATLLVAKFLNGAGSGSLENGVRSLEWAFEQGADVTSNSWGSSCSSSGLSLMQTVRTLTDLGMVSVFAAGNSGPSSRSIGGPACSESAVTVGAVMGNGVIADFSSRGPCRDIETNTPDRVCPDVVAKGANVRSAIPRANAAASDPSGYRTWSGTSMATPHIAGAVALMEQLKRDLDGEGWATSARHEEKALKWASLDLGAGGPDDTYGWGLPKLTQVRALLTGTEPAVQHVFGVSRSILRTGDATTLSFSVGNAAATPVAGAFRVSLEAPDGAVSVLRDETVTLGLFDETSFSTTFTVVGATLPGTYVFRASYAYGWTDPTTGEPRSALIEREGSFEVKRPAVAVELEGFAAHALPLTPQELVWTGTSLGNERAADVVVEFTLPDAYVFLPSETWDPAKPLTRYAHPAPDAVREDANFGRVTLIFHVGTLTEGESFSFTTRVAATEPGTHRAVSVVKFVDGGNKPRATSQTHTQVVGIV